MQLTSAKKKGLTRASTTVTVEKKKEKRTHLSWLTHSLNRKNESDASWKEGKGPASKQSGCTVGSS
jgi:hypothetical protein